MSYPSDLSEGQWEKIALFFERPDPRGARSKHSKKRTVEAILYRLREGCRWHALPPWSTVASHFRLWRRRGVWQQAVLMLGTRWREVTPGRARRAPRQAILDSQGVKTVAEGEEHGFSCHTRCPCQPVLLQPRWCRTPSRVSCLDGAFVAVWKQDQDDEPDPASQGLRA